MSTRARCCLITGTSGGLGMALVSAFADKNIKLILHARKPLLAPCHNAIWIYGDLSEDATLTQLGEVIKQHHPNILVNNAADLGPMGNAWELDMERVRQTIDTNLLVPMQLCAFVVPEMLKRGYGKIINISGGGAANVRPYFTPYAACKTALVRYSECLAQELLGKNIDVNCVAPGAMKTAMTEKILAAGSQAGEKEVNGARKLADNGNVMHKAASLCAFLASPESDGITGKLISAPWDPWETLPLHRDELADSDIYTLRRILPKDRGKDWGEPTL